MRRIRPSVPLIVSRTVSAGNGVALGPGASRLNLRSLFNLTKRGEVRRRTLDPERVGSGRLAADVRS